MPGRGDVTTGICTFRGGSASTRTAPSILIGAIARVSMGRKPAVSGGNSS